LIGGGGFNSEPENLPT
jgi:hypothetical protein